MFLAKKDPFSDASEGDEIFYLNLNIVYYLPREAAVYYHGTGALILTFISHYSKPEMKLGMKKKSGLEEVAVHKCRPFDWRISI